MAERRTSKHKLKFPPALLALRTAYMYLFVCLSKGPAPAAALAPSLTLPRFGILRAYSCTVHTVICIRDFLDPIWNLRSLLDRAVGCSFVNVMSPRVAGCWAMRVRVWALAAVHASRRALAGRACTHAEA